MFKRTKKIDLIKPEIERLESQSHRWGNLCLVVDSVYSAMQQSTRRFIRGHNSRTKESMKKARKCLKTNDYRRYGFAHIESWKECVRDYNQLARFYRYQGLDVKLVVIESQ